MHTQQVYAPVWDEGLKIEAKREMLILGTYSDVQVVPLMVATDSPIVDYTKDIFPARTENVRRCKLILWPRTGEPCVAVSHPTKDGVKYPHGSWLDTEQCPLWAVHPLCLRQFLQVRGIHLRQREKDRTLRKLFKRSQRLKKQPLPLEVRTNDSICSHTSKLYHTRYRNGKSFGSTNSTSM